MQAHFEFDIRPTPQNYLDVDDIGNCALECYNEEGMYYYILVMTECGQTTITRCGPVMPDIDMLPNGFSVSLTRMEYKDTKIESDIDRFLCDTKKKIVSAREISREEAIACIRDVKEGNSPV